jgi:hypothetical protein
MAQITIEVSDSLAKRLTTVKDRIPEMLAREIEQPFPLLNEVYRYVLEFLAGTPSPQAIIDFKPTPAMQERISELLEKNGEDELTSAESAELDEYAYINRLLSTLKAGAFKELKATS